MAKKDTDLQRDVFRMVEVAQKVVADKEQDTRSLLTGLHGLNGGAAHVSDLQKNAVPSIRHSLVTVDTKQSSTLAPQLSTTQEVFVSKIERHSERFR